MDSVTVEDWSEEIFAERVGVKWKKMDTNCHPPPPPKPYPASAPTLYLSSIQLQDGGIEPIYPAFRSEITPALQVKNQLEIP